MTKNVNNTTPWNCEKAELGSYMKKFHTISTVKVYETDKEIAATIMKSSASDKKRYSAYSFAIIK